MSPAFSVALGADGKASAVHLPNSKSVIGCTILGCKPETNGVYIPEMLPFPQYLSRHVARNSLLCEG